MPGRDGLGKRVGEASNPGPADDQMASTVDDSMGIESALEFDLTQLDSDHGVSGSETESCAEERNAHRNRRLRLTWAQEWHPDARAAECVMRELAARIGHVPPEAPVPRAIRQQRWSPMNVPLMWAAASVSETTPVLQWLTQVAPGIPESIDFHDSHVSAAEAVTVGWAALRAVFRSWEVHESEQLSVWMRRQGFPAVRPGSHISARAHEFLLSEACRVDGRVALLEAVYVVIAIHMGRGGVVPPDRAFGIESRRTVGRPPVPTTSVDSNWLQLDQVSLEEIFALRIPMLKSCPHYLRGRVRESFNFALRERFKARLEGNVEAETRAWKLFGLIPIMLLHKPYGTGSVGRSELGHRVDDFARGLWTDLIQSARDTVPRPRPIPPVSMVQEQERRGRAAQNRVQQGQVQGPP